MPIDLSDNVRTLLDGDNYATIATLDADGGPHTAVVCVVREGNAVLVSTTANSKKTRNLAQDSRISISVFDAHNPGRSVNIRGSVEINDDADKSLLRKVYVKYLGDDSTVNQDGNSWVEIRITPQKITTYGW